VLGGVGISLLHRWKEDISVMEESWREKQIMLK
jgi:hypothetical protein